MARYTVHVPSRPEVRAEALERAVFVRDGWSWAAFFLGPLWLMWNRHWITGLLMLVIMGALLAGLAALPVSEATKGGVVFLAMLLWGFEGSSLRRLALTRAGYPEEGLVVGDSLDALEQRFFAEADEKVLVQPVAPATIGMGSTPGSARLGGVPIIGLFPDSRKPS